jgi:hypothetical protein
VSQTIRGCEAKKEIYRKEITKEAYISSIFERIRRLEFKLEVFYGIDNYFSVSLKKKQACDPETLS